MAATCCRTPPATAPISTTYERPLGSQNPHELKSGDILRIGEYHVQVQIDSSTDFSLDDSALYRKSPGSTGSRRRTPPSDLGASLRLENLLEASNDISSDELKPVNAFGQAVSARTRALHQTQDLPKEATTAPELDVDSAAVARRIARLAKAATKQQQAKQQTSPAAAPASRCPLPSCRRLPRRRTKTLPVCRRSAAALASAPKHCRWMHMPACCIWPDSCCASPCSGSRKATAPSRNNAIPCA